uniref:Uncharacterized protein n=2 Tax=Spongospora subterranea TaxID=70186 RepID=A0A0H5R8M3_9EUKA|eukprot:CRZ10067.1 hypothetical protein [Spongospora subterranea]
MGRDGDQETVASIDLGTSFIAKVTTALGRHDDAAISSAIKSLMEISRTTMASAVCASTDLPFSINHCILTESSPSIVKWLFELLTDDDQALCDFVFQFIPTLSWTFLRRIQSAKPASAVGVLLQAICLRRSDCGSLEDRFQLDNPLPDLSIPSMYHSPTPIQKQAATTALTANQLRDHDLRSRVGTSVNVEYIHVSDPSTMSSIKLIRSALSKFILAMPRMSSTSVTNFCLLSARLCASDSANLSQFTQLIWDLATEKQTFCAQSLSMVELEQLLVQGLTHALITEGCRSVAIVAITALHRKATQDINPVILLSTTCLMERIRYEL